MKLAYFPNQIARNAAPVLESIINGAHRRGLQTVTEDLDADAVLIWSVLWHGRMSPNKAIYQHYRNLNRPVVVVDVGALSRGHTWKIALNNINRCGYYGHQENLDFDRPTKLKISLNHATETRPEIVIAAQHTGSLQIQDIDLTGWIEDRIKDIRKVSDRSIILRPHPRCRMDLQRFQRLGLQIQPPRHIPGTYDSFDLEFKYHAIVNYNSGPGIQSAIAGVRPIVNSSSLAFPVSTEINDIESPYQIDREKWFIEICHTEYTLEEISEGSWVQRLHLKS